MNTAMIEDKDHIIMIMNVNDIKSRLELLLSLFLHYTISARAKSIIYKIYFPIAKRFALNKESFRFHFSSRCN